MRVLGVDEGAVRTKTTSPFRGGLNSLQFASFQRYTMIGNRINLTYNCHNILFVETFQPVFPLAFVETAMRQFTPFNVDRHSDTIKCLIYIPYRSSDPHPMTFMALTRVLRGQLSFPFYLIYQFLNRSLREKPIVLNDLIPLNNLNDLIPMNNLPDLIAMNNLRNLPDLLGLNDLIPRNVLIPTIRIILIRKRTGEIQNRQCHHASSESDQNGIGIR